MTLWLLVIAEEVELGEGWAVEGKLAAIFDFRDAVTEEEAAEGEREETVSVECVLGAEEKEVEVEEEAGGEEEEGGGEAGGE